MENLYETVGGTYISPFTTSTIIPAEREAARKKFDYGIWAKNPANKIIDIEAFHKAWDPLLDKYGLLVLFDRNGDLLQTVNGKPSYALIKELAAKNPGEKALVSALKNFWGANYSKTISNRIGNKNFGQLYNKKQATAPSSSNNNTSTNSPATVLDVVMPLLKSNSELLRLYCELDSEIEVPLGSIRIKKFAIFFFGDNDFTDIYKLTVTGTGFPNNHIELQILPSKQYVAASDYPFDINDAIIAGIAVSIEADSGYSGPVSYISYSYDSSICPTPKASGGQQKTTNRIVLANYSKFIKLPKFDCFELYK